MGDLIGFLKEILPQAGYSILSIVLMAASLAIFAGFMWLLFRAMFFAFERLGINRILLRRKIRLVKSCKKREFTEAGSGARQIPLEIGELTHLESLVFSDNCIQELPPQIGQLTLLQKLDLQSNRLAYLPREIGSLAQLRQLLLKGNRLESLPPQIGGLKRLYELGIPKNLMTELPAEIGQLTLLKKLAAEHNRLPRLPAEIGRLTKLEELTLSRNCLEVLPAGIGQLTGLHTLDVSHNRLVSLPVEIGQMANLQVLDLSHNNITHLPVELGNLQCLTKLNLDGNPLVFPPQNVVRKGGQAILGFLREKAGASREPAAKAKRVREEILTGTARNVTPVAGGEPAYIVLDLEGWNIAIDVHSDAQGKKENPISEGDSLIAVIDWGRTRGREWEENGAIREAHAAECLAYKNISRGYTERQSPAFLSLIGAAIISIGSFLMVRSGAQLPPPSPPQTGIFETLRIIAPIGGYASAVVFGLFVPLILRATYRIYRAGFQVRRRALETAAGTVQDAGRPLQGAFTVTLGGQDAVFPARFGGTIHDGDRIAVVSERVSPARLDAKWYKNVTTGASGSTANWREILFPLGWKLAAAAGLAEGLLAFGGDGAEWDVLLWVSRFAAFGTFLWIVVSSLEEFFAWRLHRAARQQLKEALQEA